jgi:FdhD protein
MSRPDLTAETVAARRVGFADLSDADGERIVPVETPIAFEFDGVGYAVMMATPADLEDFGVGFALSERLVERIEDVADVSPAELPRGWVLRVTLRGALRERLFERVRLRLTEGSCGLCGLETIEQVLRPLPTVGPAAPTTRAAIAKALGALQDRQPLGNATGAAHAAAFCSPDGEIAVVREDVGRHNAMDKLIGAAARAGVDLKAGFILLTARCSYELVEKAVVAGCPMLVTISAPTSLAVERAVEAGLTLAALARKDSMLVVNDPSHAIC